MNWGSRAECQCPSTVWEGTKFWSRVYTKKYTIRCQISRSKTRYIVFQHKLLFNLVKDLFKWIEGLGRSVTVQVQSEREKSFDLGCIRKSTRYVVKFRAQKLAIVFQHKLLFNLVKDFFKWFESLGRSNTARVQCERKIIVDLGGIRKKYWIGCQISRSKSRYKVFQHELLFNIVEDLFKWIEVLERSVNVRVQSERERNFDLGCIRKSTRYVVKFRAQKLDI